MSAVCDKYYARLPPNTFLLALLFQVHTDLNGENRGIKLRHCQAKVRLDPRLPVIREPLLNQHRHQIVDTAAKDREHRRRVCAAEHVVEQTLCVLFVLRSSFAPSLAQCFAQISFGEELLSVGTSSSRSLQQLADKIKIWLALVWDKRRVSTGQAGIVLDSVVLAKLFKVESACPVRAVQEVCCEVRNEEAKGGSEVEGLVDCGLEIAERDVTAVVG